MGIEGAAIATVIGQGIAFLIQLMHLFSKKNTIAFTRISSLGKRGVRIASIGFPSFLCSAGMGIVAALFNNQIMRYFGNNELAVYGVAGNLFTLAQTFSYRIRNAAQPIVAENMGAGKTDRVHQTQTLGCYVSAGIGLAAMAAALLMPSQIVRLYIEPSAEILAIAPILRRYFTCLLFLPFNVYAAYYLQAVQRVRESAAVSLLQGILLNGTFLYLLPLMFGRGAIWYVMLCAALSKAADVRYAFFNATALHPLFLICYTIFLLLLLKE